MAKINVFFLFYMQTTPALLEVGEIIGIAIGGAVFICMLY